MRLLSAFAAVLLIGAVHAQSAAFTTKFETIVSKYLNPNTGKAVNMVGADVYNCSTTMDDIVSHLMGQVMGLLPATKYLPGMSMLSTFQSCLNKAGSSMEKAMATIGTAFKAKLTPLFNTVKTKVCTMKANGKDQKTALTEGFKIATAGLTKTLVQGIIYACMKASTAAEYACSQPPLSQIMQTANYDMNFDKTKG